MAIINSARNGLLTHDFIATIHKVHLVLFNLNNFVHSSEFWKKNYIQDELAQLCCYVYEFLRIISIMYRPILPKLMLNINKYIGVDENKVLLCNSYFRLTNEENINEVYSEFKLPEKFKQFNEESKNGYFQIYPEYKELIFIKKK
jgi:methionyl-tRNA synthetase